MRSRGLLFKQIPRSRMLEVDRVTDQSEKQ